MKESQSPCEELQDTYAEWYQQRSEDEKRLQYRAMKCEAAYFKDMSLDILRKHLAGTAPAATGTFHEKWLDEVFALTLVKWRYVLNGGLEYRGRCDTHEMMIEIRPEDKDDDIVLLHEMIHAHEFILSEASELYKQHVLLSLYKRLSRKVPALIDAVTTDRRLAVDAGHTPLFMLKSFDIDLRLEKPLGTVYSRSRNGFPTGTEAEGITAWACRGQNP